MASALTANSQSAAAVKRGRTGDLIPMNCTLGRVPTGTGLQRSQEVEDILLLLSRERIEGCDRPISFRARTGVCQDRLQQIRSPSVMQEEDPLSQSPKRTAAEFIGPRGALNDIVGQPRSHVMHQ